MNPAVLLGLGAVGLGLWFLTSKSSDSGGASPNPNPNPNPNPQPIVNKCDALIAKATGDAQVLLALIAKNPAATGDICNAYKNFQASYTDALNAKCELPDFSAIVKPAGCGGGYIPPGTDCQVELAAYNVAIQAATAAMQAFNDGALPAKAACVAIQALDAAASALSAKGCEVPDNPIDDQDVCAEPGPSDGCEALMLAYHEAANAYSSAMSQGADLGCPLEAAVVIAYDAATAAGCDMSEAYRPDGSNCGGGGGGGGGGNSSTPCQAAWAALEPAHDVYMANPADCNLRTAWAAALQAAVNCGWDVSGYTAPDLSDCGGGGASPCQALMLDYNVKANAYSAAMTQGSDVACPLEPGVVAAYDKAAAAGCDMSKSYRPANCGMVVSGALDWQAMAGFRPMPRW